MSKYPQCMINVPVSGRVNLKEHTPILAAVRASEERLAGRGRVLLRPSGTEPVVRVMVEGENEAEVRREAAELAERVAQLLNTAA
jgi:phosphoglucosamine mutase